MDSWLEMRYSDLHLLCWTDCDLLQSLTNVGTSRVRDPRIDSSFTDTLGMMAGALGR